MQANVSRRSRGTLSLILLARGSVVDSCSRESKDLVKGGKSSKNEAFCQG